MSDDWIIVIPENPDFIPDAACQAQAEACLARIAPCAEDIEVKISREVQFFDCGSNFERILCPSCHSEISLEWWQERMDDDCDDGFKLAKYLTPCCGKPHTLHDLIYEWPQGFGKFALELMNPGLGQLNEAQRHELEQTVGAPLRIIYQHV